MTHAEFIDAMGGATKVARLLGQERITVQSWKRRGIAWQFRPTLAELAKREHVALPEQFLVPATTEVA